MPTSQPTLPLPSTLAEIEHALSTNTLWAAMRNGRYWRCRRNGATRRWKLNPSRWEIPIKAGLHSCTRLTRDSRILGLTSLDQATSDFIISAIDPNEPPQ